MDVTEETPIVLNDGYTTRGVPNAFFPSVLSDYILDGEVYTSDVVSWYMKKSVESSWLILTAVANSYSVISLYHYFHNKFQIRLLNGLEKYWDELVRVGHCYYNDVLDVACQQKRLFFEKNFALLKMSSMVMHISDAEHIVENWKKFKRNKLVIPLIESSPFEEEQKKIMIQIINSGALKQMSQKTLEAFKKVYMDYFKAPLPEDVLM